MRIVLRVYSWTLQIKTAKIVLRIFMKKLLGILVLGLLWCNVGFAECIEGDCNNGYGIFNGTNGFGLE